MAFLDTVYKNITEPFLPPAETAGEGEEPAAEPVGAAGQGRRSLLRPKGSAFRL